MGKVRTGHLWLLFASGLLVFSRLPAFSQSYAITTLAGVGPGTNDGTNGAARFFYPNGTDLDAAGNLYLADSGNHIIRKITPAGLVTTIAGLPGVSGTNDGTNSAARFNNPSGVAVDAATNIYVADTGNHTIRQVTPAGVVSTLAGMAANYGTNDGTNTSARFFRPQRIAIDVNTNLYVADTFNHTIRKVTPAGTVTTLAGLGGVPGYFNGTNATALFSNPSGVAVDGATNIYVADAGNSVIRIIAPSGVVSTLAGMAGQPGSANGTNGGARFIFPCDVTVDGSTNLYVADGGAFAIRKVTSAGVVTTLAGRSGIFGSADGAGTNAQFNHPAGLTVDGAGSNLYVADSGNHTLRRITPGGAVSTLAGLAAQTGGSTDGANSAARFLGAQGVAVDGAGNAYVADTGNNTIRKITPSGVVTTLAGHPGVSGTNDGATNIALFRRPTGIAVDSATNLYVADSGNHTIRVVTPAGVVSTLAGLGGSSGYFDGTNGTARFANPAGIAVDPAGNLYVADFGNAVIRKISPSGVVSTLAGLGDSVGAADGSGTNARFTLPCGIALDAATNVYVADTFNHTIRFITPSGSVSTLAGMAGFPGTADGVSNAARFYNPHGLTVDAAGNVYVADTFNWTIRQITPAGAVSTIAGFAGSSGDADDRGSFAQFFYPYGLAVDAASNLYVADAFNHAIRKGVLYKPPLITGDLSNQTVLGDSTVTFSVNVTGAGPLFYQWRTNGVNIAGATNASYVITTALLNNSATYTLVVSNAFGSVTSQTATLTVLVPVNDAFANATLVSGTNFSVTGSNVGATKEPNEPATIAGNAGGSSVWWTWTAPADGTITLDTSSSSFDTLLAVYTGNSLASLNLLVSDDDYTNRTSLVTFGAKSNKTYRIQVDGYAGAAGSIQLNLNWSPPVPPSFSQSPQPQADIAGASVAFSAAAVGSPPLHYQWRKNGGNISGATNTTYTISRIGSSDAANYDVVVSDELGSTNSSSAVLILGSGYTITTLAGTSGYGSADGTGSAARFHFPNDLAADNAGNLYVVDSLNDTIRKILPGGVVTTLAGQAGFAGSSDGTNGTAHFNAPAGIASDNATNLYVADAGNNTIRKITPAGVVTTLAGLAGNPGSTNGTNSAARFFGPSGVVVDSAGNIYVADAGNNAIRLITPSGAVSTFAGTPGTSGSQNGPATNALFNFPESLGIDQSNNIYVADTLNSIIRKITPSGNVSTLAGTPGAVGNANGTNALFRRPEGLVADAVGNVYVVDTGNSTVRAITPAGFVSTIAGLAGTAGSADGTGTNARFSDSTGIIEDGAGNLYVTDDANNTVRKVTQGGVTTTLAGTAGSGSMDGTTSAARFNYPSGVVVDSGGNTFISDHFNHTIRKITPSGVVSTFAGLAGVSGTNDGLNNLARFFNPSGLAIDSANNLYVADSGNHAIRQITPLGIVSTLAGSGGSSGYVDATGTAARFNNPLAVAVDAATNVFVSDNGNLVIRVINPAKAVITLAGGAGYGSLDGFSTNASFAGPTGIAVDGGENVYVSDSPTSIIRKITPDGTVSTIAGSSGTIGLVDGTGSTAHFGYPAGLALDLSNNLVVADLGNNTVRLISPQGMVSTMAGFPGLTGNTDGIGVAATFLSPHDVAVDNLGYVYITDAGNYTVRTTHPPPPALQIRFSGGYAVLSWPTNATGYIVESSLNSQPIVWLPLTNAPVVMLGTNYVQSNLLTTPSSFYRLHRP